MSRSARSSTIRSRPPVLAIISIAVGNIGAIGQDSLERLMGWSGVAQAGCMLVGVAAASEPGINALVFYLAA